MSGAGKFINDKKTIPNINGYVTALIRIIHQVTHGPFPDAVEIQSDQVTFGIISKAGCEIALVGDCQRIVVRVIGRLDYAAESVGDRALVRESVLALGGSARATQSSSGGLAVVVRIPGADGSTGSVTH